MAIDLPDWPTIKSIEVPFAVEVNPQAAQFVFQYEQIGVEESRDIVNIIVDKPFETSEEKELQDILADEIRETARPFNNNGPKPII